MIHTVHRKCDRAAPGSSDFLLQDPAESDCETSVAATLRYDVGGSRREGLRTIPPVESKTRPPRPHESLIQDIQRAVATRLPGRICGLAVRTENDDRYVLSGVTSSYYVKQLAQHLAMGLIRDGRLVNEIEVRSVR